MDDAELARRTDAGLVAYLRHLAQHAAGGRVHEEPGLLLFAGGHNYPGAFTNGVIRTADRRCPPEVVLGRAREFFGRLGRGFAVWVRGDADADLEDEARREGLWPRPPEEGNPGVATERPAPEAPLSLGVELRSVVDERTRRDYLDVVARGYGIGAVPLPMAEALLFSLASVDSPHVSAVLAYRDGRPAAGCLAYVAGRTASLQWGATVPEGRRSGLAQAVFAATCNAGFAHGVDCVTTMSSMAAVPVWQRLGFDAVTRYRRYLARPPDPTGPLSADGTRAR